MRPVPQRPRPGARFVYGAEGSWRRLWLAVTFSNRLIVSQARDQVLTEPCNFTEKPANLAEKAGPRQPRFGSGDDESLPVRRAYVGRRAQPAQGGGSRGFVAPEELRGAGLSCRECRPPGAKGRADQ